MLQAGSKNRNQENVIIRTQGREEFCNLFSYLADAIDPRHFDDSPVITITGGGGAGKSLAADVMFQAFDDLSFLKAERNDFSGRASDRFSREVCRAEATYVPVTFDMPSGGMMRRFMFASGWRYLFGSEQISELVSYYSYKAGGNGAMIITGAHEDMSEFEWLRINVGDHLFKNEGSRYINIITPPASPLEQCPRFQAYLDKMRQGYPGFCPAQPSLVSLFMEKVKNYFLPDYVQDIPGKPPRFSQPDPTSWR